MFLLRLILFDVVHGPCEGYISSYLANCNYLGVPALPSHIQWIEDLFAADNHGIICFVVFPLLLYLCIYNHVVEFKLTLAPGVAVKSELSPDIQSVIRPLADNSWFTAIELKVLASSRFGFC